jgi:putative ABC transport system permease protein
VRLVDLDRWQEVLDTVRKNKLRALLTSLAVVWGVFMLVVLLGAGNGLRNGVVYLFRDDAVNSIWLYPGKTTMPYAGHAVGRPVRFTNDDFFAIRAALPVEHITSRFYPSGEVTVTYKEQHAAFDLRAVHPDHLFLERTEMTAGRFIDDLDLRERRKVAVIGAAVVELLFPGENPLGLRIDIGGISHEIVGVFEDPGEAGERRKIYVPITTAQLAWGGGGRNVAQIMFTLLPKATVADSKRAAEEARRLLARRHEFSPDDKDAVFVRNNLENFQRVSGVVDGIAAFVWLIGLGTIVASIVGVSNIMLISVRERTREIGLRKALGATPGSIVGLVLAEAVLLTSAAGYLGLLCGVGALEAARNLLPESDYFRDPEVDVRLVVTATVVLVAAGALAGFFPARRAARVSPVVALRDE